MTDLLNPYAKRSKRTVEITTDFPGSVLPSSLFNNPKSATLRQKMKSHDVMVLRYETELRDNRLLRTGSPVSVSWATTNVGETAQWVGYVHTVRPRRIGNTYGQTEIVCVSPSMILKQAAQETWTNTPVMSAAYDIVTKSGLEATMSGHPLSDNIIQHGRTYWQVLRDIAEITGYSLTTDNTEIIMIPHKAFFDRYSARARVFSPGASMEIDPKNSDRTLYSFAPDWSDMSEDDYALHAQMTAWSVDPRTGMVQQASTKAPSSQVSLQREDPVVQRYSTRAAYGFGEAQRLAEDSLADKRWINQATLIGMGSPDIKPYRPVYVENMSDSVDGWWQVLEVDHEITNRAEYQVTARVGRDGSNPTYPKPSTLPTLPGTEIAYRAYNAQTKRGPSFVTSSPNSKGLTGFGDVGGYWVSRRTR